MIARVKSLELSDLTNKNTFNNELGFPVKKWIAERRERI